MREKFDRKNGHVNIGEIGKDKFDKLTAGMTAEEKKKFLDEYKNRLINNIMIHSTDSVETVDYVPLDLDEKHNTK